MHTICRDCRNQQNRNSIQPLLAQPVPTQSRPTAALPQHRYEAAFIQSSGDGFSEQFERFDANDGYQPSFHWVAAIVTFLAPPLWFVHRKLYGWALAFFLAEVATSFIIPVTTNGSDTTGWGYAQGIAIAIAGGALAHYAYWQKMHNAIRTAKARYSTNDAILLDLSRRGGTNLYGVLLIIAIYLILGMGLAVLTVLEGYGWF